MSGSICTIGHSTHPIDQFISILKKHHITAICDVRSTPFSHATPQFNKEALRVALVKAGINYVFFGDRLGARTKDESCYENGQVQFDRLAAAPAFAEGITRVQTGNTKFQIALMCAEAEPIECHRTILVARRLQELGTPIRHILKDGSLESQDDAIVRLKRHLGIPDIDMSRTPEQLIEDAYRQQESRIAYRIPGYDRPWAGLDKGAQSVRA